MVSQGVELGGRGAGDGAQILGACRQDVEAGEDGDEVVRQGAEREWLDATARIERAQPTLQDCTADGDVVVVPREVGTELAGDGRKQSGARRHVCGGGDKRGRRRLEDKLTTRRGVTVSERDAVLCAHDVQSSGGRQLGQAGGRLWLVTGDREHRSRIARRGCRTGGMHRGAAGCARSVGKVVDRQGADDQQVEVPRFWLWGRRRVGKHRSIIHADMQLHVYELHEGATDLMTDALLVSEHRYSADEFERMVRAARQKVLETFEEDTLAEAVARELERMGSFIYLGDDRIEASMSIGVEDADTFAIEQSDEYRSIVVELDKSS